MTTSTFFGLFVAPALLFALVYPVMTRHTRGLVSPYPKADIRRRLYAAAIDGSVVATSWFMFLNLESVSFLLGGALYLLLRDAMRGQSLGKVICGLVVISVETGRPATLKGSVQRNLLLLLPGANVVAIFLEAITLTRDTQGQRLGDRLAQTQVIEGLGLRELIEAMQRWWRGVLSEVTRSGRPKRAPVGPDR
ncbi:MAG TPA: RDD family protein [Vicinamibacterales bacterium]|nr:RDD family protein [Vicinamibacterales bacterium]